MTIVTNTGPLIALAKINYLTLLQQLFTTIAIPPAVHRELLAKSGPEAARLDHALNNFIVVQSRPEMPAVVRIVTDALDAGEQEAIALAYQQQTLLVIDERLGREAARRLGLTSTGTIGVLLEGKRRGHVAAVLPQLQEMRQQGYWLSDDVLRVAANLSGEKM
jgi:uncharacterized protein